MIALLYLVLALALGVSAVRWSGIQLNIFEFSAAVIIIGFFCFTWLMVLPCIVLPYAVALPIGVVLTLGAIALLWVRGEWAGGSRRGYFTASMAFDQWVLVMWSVLAAASMLFWLTLMWTHDLNPVNGSLQSVGSTWADFGLHANIITHQAYASRLPGDMPIASGTNMTYPFLVDFLSALFLKGGWSLHMCLVVPGTLLAWGITQLLLGFGRRLFGSFIGAFIGTVLTFCGGSFIGITLAWQGYLNSGGVSDFLGKIPDNYSGSWAHNAPFFNPVADLLLPQRAFLFGLGAWLVIAIAWHRAIVGPRAGASDITDADSTGAGSDPIDSVGKRGLFGGAVLFGLLPMAHAHSFVSVATLFAGLFVWILLKRRAEVRSWLWALAVAVVLALPQLGWQQFAVPSGTGGFFTHGWTRDPSDPLLHYEWRNFGFFLVVLLVLIFLLTRPFYAQFRAWLIPFLVLFVVAQIYSLQPLAYDNLKLLFYVYLISMLALGALLMKLPAPSLRVSAAVLAFLGIGVGGALTIVREYQFTYTFATSDDLALAQWVKTHTSIDAVFAGTPSTGESPGTVGGRRLLMAYPGWLINYHLDSTPRQAAIAALLKGDVNDANVLKYKPDYLFVSSYEQAGTTDPTALAKLDKVYSNATWTVYKLR